MKCANEIMSYFELITTGYINIIIEKKYIYYNNTPQQQIVSQPIDIFGNLDRTAYILIFVTFILGFFMGKTMQPVIIRQ